MSEDNKLSFLLDLDVKEFTEKTLQAKGTVEKLGSEENLSGLLEGLAKVGPLLAAAGVAAFAFKSAIDLTIEGETINRINHQFEILAHNAGIVPDKLKKGLEEAAAGLMDTTDLLKVANEALVKMGAGAEKLPELLELARKATTVFGGDAKANFEAITNAIANGNVKQLAHLGLKVDMAKAERDFAKSIGVTTEELNLAGKQQALLNAVLEEGNKHYEGVTTSTTSATSSLQLIKVAFHEVGEAFTMVFEKTVGPGIRSFLSTFANVAKQIKLTVQSEIGEGSEKAAAKISLLKDKISETEKVLEKLKATGGKGLDGGYSGENEARLKLLPGKLEQYRAELVKLEGANKSLEKAVASETQKELDGISKVSNARFVDTEKSKKQRLAFEAEMSKLDKADALEKQKNVKTLEQVEKSVLKQRLLNEKAHLDAIAKIKANDHINDSQKGRLEVAENQRFQDEMVRADDEAMQLRHKLLDNYVHNSTTAFNGIENAFRANTLKMQDELKDFGKRGTEVFNSLSTNSTSAFSTMGQQMAAGKDIGTATADALRGVFLGMLADRAAAEGKIMLLSGIFPPNPAAIAGGVALLALGGVLKAAAGPSAAGSTIASSPSAAAVGSGAAPYIAPISHGGNTSAPSSDDQSKITAGMQQTQNQRIVNVNIAGNYLETDSSKRMLMDLMRQESDATGFNYNQIGA